jgi:hypothetical protein
MIAVAHAVDLDALRLRHEFLSMPALVLSAPQAARLLNIRTDRAAAILAGLEEEGWLIRSSSGLYRRSEPALT